MNTWNSMEERLRKWTPRTPSPELKKRLFAAAEKEIATPLFSFRDISRWVIPAFGCFLLVLSSLSAKFQESTVKTLPANFLTASNRTEASANIYYGRTSEHSDINNVPCKHLEYNFGGRAPLASLGTILISYTNRLIE